jgi:RHS repeat-associated protein
MTLSAACAFSTASSFPPHSTGKERDAESGNDYFLARYYNSATGRFLSPDWDAKSSDPVPYAKLDNPQSLNLYAYVLNNPVDKTDPDGHKCDSDLCQKLLNKVTGHGWKTDKEVFPAPTPRKWDDPKPPSAEPLAYKPGANVPSSNSALGKLLQCTNGCMLGVHLTVTSTNEKVPGHPEIHGADTPHGRGEAADIKTGADGAGLGMFCAAQCGAKFGQNEYANPSSHATGLHDHIQTTPGINGGRGDLPAIVVPEVVH